MGGYCPGGIRGCPIAYLEANANGTAHTRRKPDQTRFVNKDTASDPPGLSLLYPGNVARTRRFTTDERQATAMSAPSITLNTIAHGRSGDKGNHANVAVIAYTPAGYAFLREYLTPRRVLDYFSALGPSQVVRYEVPNVLGLNFVLNDVLAGGASRSLRIDSQGKTYALALLQMPIERPDGYESMLRPRKQP